MGIADRIAEKRRELALFVTESASAVIAEEMTDAMRGAAALDLLKLMVASGLSAPAGPLLDVTPAPVESEWTFPKPTPNVVRPSLSPRNNATLREKMAAETPVPTSEPVWTQTNVGFVDIAPEPAVVEPKPRVGAKARFSDDMIADALKVSDGVQSAAAVALGCSDQTIYNYRKRAGLLDADTNANRRMHSDAEIAAALAAVDGDRKLAAERLGCSINTVDRHRKEHGIRSASSDVTWTPANIERLRDLRRSRRVRRKRNSRRGSERPRMPSRPRCPVTESLRGTLQGRRTNHPICPDSRSATA